MKQPSGYALLILLILVTACGSAKAGPAQVVEQAFTAFRQSDSNAINELMSEQGQANAAAYCGGAAINCLKSNYQSSQLKSSSTTVASQSDTAAEVVLRTTWSDLAGEFCQTYKLDKTDNGWRITYFDQPQNCPS